MPHLQLPLRGAGEPSVHRNKSLRGFSHPQGPNSSQGEETEKANSKGKYLLGPPVDLLYNRYKGELVFSLAELTSWKCGREDASSMIQYDAAV